MYYSPLPSLIQIKNQLKTERENIMESCNFYNLTPRRSHMTQDWKRTRKI